MRKVTFEQRLRGVRREVCPAEGALPLSGEHIWSILGAAKSPVDGGVSIAKSRGRGGPQRACCLPGIPSFIYLS